jgi:hypothetical protein
MAGLTLWHSRAVPWRWGRLCVRQWSPGERPWHWRLFLACHIGQRPAPYRNGYGFYGRHCRRFIALLWTPVLVWQTNDARMVGVFLFGWCLYLHTHGPKPAGRWVAADTDHREPGAAA